MLVMVVGCKLGKEQISINPLSPPIEWIVALDITTSIPSERFRIMRDEMIPAIVLSRVRSRDKVHILAIDSDPEDQVIVQAISGRKVGKETEIATIFTQLQERIVQPKRYRGWTNIGGALAYAKRMSQMIEGNHTAVKQAHASIPSSRVVITLFTDGKWEGKQSLQGGAWPAEVLVWFWGVERSYEASLRKWATQEMGLLDHQFFIVPFSDWQTAADQLFGPRIERPFPDRQVLQQIQRLGSLAYQH
jgi:hypothetical protein